MRREFAVVGKSAPFYLYPKPVIAGAKFLIVCKSLKEASILKFFLKESWVALDVAIQGECEPHWREAGIHKDQETKLFEMDWSALRLAYLSRSLDAGTDRDRVLKIEESLSKHVGAWAAVDFLMESESHCALQKKIQSQRACSSCQAAGIGNVNFVFLN